MSYKTRNILVLFLFVLLILVFDGYYLLFSYPGKIRKATVEIQDLKRKIKSLEGIEDQFKALQEQIEQKEKKLSKLNKKIVARVTPAQTYHYLNRILNYIGFLEFNMLFTGSQEFGDYGYNAYHVKGEGTFKKIYNFIWYIERGPQIYKVEKLYLHGVETKDPDTEIPQLIIPFEMEIWAYFAKLEDLPPIHRSLNDVRVAVVKNPFYPFILRNLPPNTNNLLEVERAELKAIIPGKALIADFNGRIHTLKEGDRVYLGFLAKIDPERNQVEFTLNKGGVYEKFILKLRFDNRNELERNS